MFRLTILLCVLVEIIRARTTTHTDKPETLDEKLDKLIEKLNRNPILPIEDISDPYSRLHDKLNQLDSLNFNLDDNGLTAEEEMILSKLQQGAGLTEEELSDFAKDLQDLREENQLNMIINKGNEEDLDDGWVEPQDEIEEYVMDREVWDTYEDRDEVSTIMPKLPPANDDAESDSRFTEDSERKPEKTAAVFRPGIESIATMIDPIAATNERPIIISDAGLSIAEMSSIRKAALVNMGNVVRAAKCLIPQPRWLQVRQLAPAANTIYMPPCVQLHRCAPDSGCCDNEAEMCAPVDGKHVEIALFLKKSDGKLSVVRMLFYNHTSCACLPRDNPRPKLFPRPTAPTEPEITRDDEPANLKTSPPELDSFRCTCPGLFQATVREGTCTCQCDWPDPARRNGCSPLARGKEHFGLKDRYCIARGTCTTPTCKYGEYDRVTGKCPMRRFKKIRYQYRSRS